MLVKSQELHLINFAHRSCVILCTINLTQNFAKLGILTYKFVTYQTKGIVCTYIQQIHPSSLDFNSKYIEISH